MSTDVNCEVCGTVGSIPMWVKPMVPFGWFFSEIATDVEDGEDPREVRKDPHRCSVVFACSETCRDAFWTRGKTREEHVRQRREGAA